MGSCKEGFMEGYKEGYKEGIKLGKLKRSREIARKMLLLNLDKKLISEVTDVSADEIDRIKCER